MTKTTAKNDVRLIKKVLEEFLGKRKSSIIATEIHAAMQEESRHTHNGKVFYIHEDEKGELVVTTESLIAYKLEFILGSYLEEDEVNECLEMLLSRKTNLTEKVNNESTKIKKEKQECLEIQKEEELSLYKEHPFVPISESKTIKINGSDSEIYSIVLNFCYSATGRGTFNLVDEFKDNLATAITASVPDFEVFVCDPSIDKNGNLQFVPGAKPAVGLSLDEWEELARINGLRIGNKHEYILFISTLLYKMIKNGWGKYDAFRALFQCSQDLGHYIDSQDAKETFEPTGSREFMGKCDLANTNKLLANDNDFMYFAGGHYFTYSNVDPIAQISNFNKQEIMYYNIYSSHIVGWFVR